MKKSKDNVAREQFPEIGATFQVYRGTEYVEAWDTEEELKAAMSELARGTVFIFKVVPYAIAENTMKTTITII